MNGSSVMNRIGYSLNDAKTAAEMRLSACRKTAVLGTGNVPAKFLYNLTKNLSAHLYHHLCAVLP